MIRAASSTMAVAQVAAPPVVTPTRRQIDRRFPALGFTVVTGAHPWFEVLLATDPGLFDPGRASERTPERFYTSRVDGGLTPAPDGAGRYVVPANVLTRFLSASPRPSALSFLAVSYADATGTGGLPSAVVGGAPASVALSASLGTGKGRRAVRLPVAGRGLSMAAEPSTTEVASDRREGEDGRDVGRGSVVGTAAAQGLPGLDVDDRRAGEDGRDVAPTAVAPVAPAPAPPPAPSPVPVSGPVAAPPASAPPPALPAPIPAPASLDDHWPDYEDGWEGWDQSGEPGRAAANPLPGLDDEFADVRWDTADAGRYGPEPAALALDDPTDTGPGTAPAPAPVSPAPVPTVQPAPAVLRRIVERTTAGEDGSGYTAVNADGAFRGRFGPDHKAYQRYHVGLSFGIAEFNQDSGTLGQLLTLMHDRDPAQFAADFGGAVPGRDPQAVVEALLAVVTAPGPSSEHVEGGRGPRVQPVLGADLWEEPWVSAFRASGRHPAFQAAQNQLAAELFLAPMLPLAAGFGLGTERALCLLLDRAVLFGVDGARRWVADTVGPLRTPALRQQALASLGFDSIEAFQRSTAGLLVDGEFGPLTHAALTAALRRHDSSSPVPLPTTVQMVEAMAARAEREPGAARFARLHADADLGDDPVGS